LVGVSAQGVLGILRVQLNEQLNPDVGATLALIHGCTAQLVFALLMSIALWTSSAWQRASQGARATLTIRRASLVLAGLIYLQIVFGAVMRHKELALGTRTHILLSFVVVAAAVWLGNRVLQTPAADTLGRRSVWVLWSLLAVQLILGLETMLSKFNVTWGYTGQRVEPAVQAPDLIRSVHFLVGALVFSTAVAIVLVAHRRIEWAARPVLAPSRQLEGAL
jgi:heme a synthase